MDTFSALPVLCERNPLVTGGFPSQSPVVASLDIFFYLRLNKGLSKQSRHRWFETLWRSLWRRCNDCRQDCLNFMMMSWHGNAFCITAHLWVESKGHRVTLRYVLITLLKIPCGRANHLYGVFTTHILEWRTVYPLTKGYLGAYSPYINIKITLERAFKEFVTNVHRWFYFLHDIRDRKITIREAVFTNRLRVSPSLRSADNVTIENMTCHDWDAATVLFMVIFTTGRVRKWYYKNKLVIFGSAIDFTEIPR